MIDTMGVIFYTQEVNSMIGTRVTPDADQNDHDVQLSQKDEQMLVRILRQICLLEKRYKERPHAHHIKKDM